MHPPVHRLTGSYGRRGGLQTEVGRNWIYSVACTLLQPLSPVCNQFRFHREVRNMKFCISIHGSTRSYINNSAGNIQREIHQSGGLSVVFFAYSLGSEADATCVFCYAQPTQGWTLFCCYCMDKAIRINGSNLLLNFN